MGVVFSCCFRSVVPFVVALDCTNYVIVISYPVPFMGGSAEKTDKFNLKAHLKAR